MVQIIPMERAPSLSQALGAGLGQGLSQGINYGIQDMLQQKSNAKQNKSLLAALGPETTKSLGLNEADVDKFAGLDPKIFMSVLDMKRQQMSLRDLSSSQLNSPLNRPGNEGSIEREQIPTKRTLPPGIAPMLEYQDIPAEEDISQPSKTPVRMQSTKPEAKMKNVPYQQREQELRDYWDNLIQSAPQEVAGKYISAKEKDLDNLRRNEELSEKIKKTKISSEESKYRKKQDLLNIEKDVRKDYLKPLKKSNEALEQSQSDLQNIVDLSKGKGNVSKWKLALSKYFNLDENLLLNPTEEIINKLSNNLMPGVAQRYAGTGRILASEASAFAKTIPNLMQSEKGIQTVAKYIMKSNELKMAEYEEAQKLAREFADKKQNLPVNFEDMVEDRTEPKRKKILREMHDMFMEQQTGIPKGYVKMMDQKGKPKAVPEERVKEMLDQGFSTIWPTK